MLWLSEQAQIVSLSGFVGIYMLIKLESFDSNDGNGVLFCAAFIDFENFQFDGCTHCS